MLDYAQILTQLKAKTTANPEVMTWVSLYFDLFAAQARADVQHCVKTANTDTLIARLSNGQPLLSPEDFRADRTAFFRLCHEICNIVAKHHFEFIACIDTVRAWLDEDQASVTGWASLLSEDLARRGEDDGGEVPLLAFVYNQGLHPFLRRYAEMLMPHVDGVIWYRPNCPICGGRPDLAALTRTNGTRQFLCSRCDAEWFSLRTGCPFCGEDNPAEQTFSISKDGAYRLYLCDHCKRYLKTIDLRQVTDERLLPVERILTAPMDVAAHKGGYSAV